MENMSISQFMQKHKLSQFTKHFSNQTSKIYKLADLNWIQCDDVLKMGEFLDSIQIPVKYQYTIIRAIQQDLWGFAGNNSTVDDAIEIYDDVEDDDNF